MTDLDALLRAADPAYLTPDVADAARDLARRTSGLVPDSRRPGRVRRPVLVGAVVGALAIAGGMAFAATTHLDLFSPGSPITVTAPLGDIGSCTVYVNLVPADGETHTDKSGLEVTRGSAATFDQHEFDVTVQFVQRYDWSSVVAKFDHSADVRVTTPEGPSTVGGVFDPRQVTAVVQGVLAQNGIDTGGSAAVVTVSSCGLRARP